MRVFWTKITIIYNLRNVYQTKDIQPWSESLNSVQVWVNGKSYNCALAHCSCKNTAERFDRYVTSRSKLFSTRTLSAFSCCCCLGISSSGLRGGDCRRVSKSGTEHIQASDSFSESQRTPRWFFVAGKDSSRHRFGSKCSKCSTPSWIFRKNRIVGVSWLILSPSAEKETWGKTRMFTFCPSELTAVDQFLHLTVSSFICQVKAGSEITKNGLLSGSINALMAALRWISSMNFCKLTVCHLFSSQTCKTFAEKHLVPLLIFPRSVSKILCYED